MKGPRRSSNVRDNRNPFMLLNPLITLPTPTNSVQVSTPETRNMARKQDRPTVGDAAFDRKYGFKTGMDRAAEADRMAERYRRGQASPGMYPAGWQPGDAWTTARRDAPASMTRRNRPTPSDAMDAARRRGIERPAYFDAETQRAQETFNRIVQEEQKAFEKGKELARSKMARDMLKGMRGPGGQKM